MSTDSDDKLIKELAALAPKLDRVLVSATIDARGRLGVVAGLAEKVTAAKQLDTLQAIQAFAVAADQRTTTNQELWSVTEFKHRIVDSEGYDTSCRQPLVMAADFRALVHSLDKTFNAPARFSVRLGLPQELVDDARYAAQQYYGRAWLRDAITAFIETQRHEERGAYIVIAADAIWGKTSFALDWYRRTTDQSRRAVSGSNSALLPLAGWAFIRKEAGGPWVDPISILLGLEAETRYQRNLPAGKAPNRSDFYQNEQALETHFHAFFKDLGEEASRANVPAVLLLDGVDEIWGPSGEKPSHLLPGALPRQLPTGVFVVLLSRPGYHLRWKGGELRTPLLMLDLAAAAQTGGGGDRKRAWIDQNQEDLVNYLDWRIAALNQQYQFDFADQLQMLKPELLKAAQGFMFVLTTLLAPADDLPERIKQWVSDPGCLPRGPRQLVARVVTRIIERVERPIQRSRLDPTDRVSQVLAGLGLTACLRQPMGVDALLRLLFDDQGLPAASDLPLSGRCGSLRWNQLDEGVFKEMLSLGAECFVGNQMHLLPHSTSFWHPEMRHLVRAAWHHAASHGGAPTETDLLTAADALQAQDVAYEERPLHLFLATTSFRHWRAACNTLSNFEREARSYALAWGPWHAAVSGDEAALQEAAEVLVDPVYLQAAYAVLGAQAHHVLDASFEAVLESTQGFGAHLARRLLNVRRSLSQHDTLFSHGSLRVAATLYNDLGGMDALNPTWRLKLRDGAHDEQQLVRRWPGASSPLLHRIDRVGEDSFPSDHFAISPCGQWLAICGGNQIRLMKVDAAGYRVASTAIVAQATGRISAIALCSRIGGGLWLASGADDGAVGLLAVNPDGTPANAMTQIKGHTGRVNCVAFSQQVVSRLWLASAANDGVVGLLSIGTDGAHKDTLTQIRGHAGKVKHVAFSQQFDDRIWLASAADGVGLIEIDLDGTHATEIARIEGHTGPVRHVAFSPLHHSRLWLASAGRGVGLLAIGPNGPRERALMRIKEDEQVSRVAFSPLADGRLWLASIYSGGVFLWAISPVGATEHELMRIKNARILWVRGVTFSPVVDGQLWLACGFIDGVRILSISETGKPERALARVEGHAGWVQQVGFSSSLDGKLWLACGARGGEVSLWSIGAHENMLPPVEGHTESVRAVAISSQVGGRLWLASSARDSCAGLLAIEADGYKKHMLARIKVDKYLAASYEDPIHNVAFSPLIDGMLWLAIGGHSHVSLLALSAVDALPRPLKLIKDLGNASIPRITFSPWVLGRAWLALRSVRHDLCLIAINADGTLAHTLTRIEKSERSVYHVAFSPVVGTRLWLASAGDDGVGLLAIDAHGELKSALTRIEGHTGTVNRVAFSPPVDGQLWLASAGNDGLGLLALDSDGTHASAMTRIEGHLGRGHCVAFSPQVSNWLWLAFSTDDEIGLLAIGAGGRYEQAVTQTNWHKKSVSYLSFSPVIGGRLWLAGASAFELSVWSVPECRLVGCVDYSGSGEKIHELRWADDGRTLYVAGSRGTSPVDLSLLIPDGLLGSKLK